MSDGISFFNNEESNKHVKLVISQTNYTEQQVIEKLKLFNCDYMRVLKDYMGIPEKKEERVKSANQEIYKQIRTRLDSTMKEYREKHPIDIDQLVENFQESDQREKHRIKN
jgi:CRISPR/Cas system CMR subunit Cmr6 (Cas7 group RAMP superfamily)